jgi:hypothetical protein
MEHYVTIFDSQFLPQGLALRQSMERHLSRYKLWVVCVDDGVFDSLQRMNLSNLEALKLSERESAELLEVKQSRTLGEYCWTLTPFSPKFVFDADQTAKRVTYLDADTWFLKDPKAIFDELQASGKNVLITEHAYADEYDQTSTAGTYCVQFMPFERTKSEAVRQWWEDRCVEWCFARVEDGRFGDQKYLDDWPVRFAKSVHVLEQKNLLQAPWNASKFDCREAVLFHFHGVRLGQGATIVTDDFYRIPDATRAGVYLPYFEDLKRALRSIESVGGDIPVQTSGPRASRAQRFRGLLSALRRFLGNRSGAG